MTLGLGRWLRGAYPMVLVLALALSTGGVEADVVVESVKAANGAARAGIRAGDLLVSWERSDASSGMTTGTNSAPAGGIFESPFDLHTVEIEQAPRGPVLISLRRAGQTLALEMGEEQWRMSSRPEFGLDDRKRYELGASLLEQDPGRTLEVWGALAGELVVRGLEIDAAWLYLKMGEADAERSEEATREFFDRALGQAKNAGHAEASAQILRSLGSVLEGKNDMEAAAGAYRDALAVRRRVANEGNAFRLVLAESLMDTGKLSWQVGEIDVSLEPLAEARRIREEEAPGSLAVAAVINALAIPKLIRGDYAGGARDVLQSFEMLQRLAPRSHDMASTSNMLANIEAHRGRLQEAERHYQRSLHIIEELDPGNQVEAKILNNLAGLMMSRGSLAVAEDYALRAREIKEEMGPRSPDVASTLANLAAIRRLRGDLEAAFELRKEAAEIWEEVSPEHFFLAGNYALMCNLAVELVRPVRAEEAYRRAMSKIERKPEQGLQVAEALRQLGSCRARSGDHETAESLYRTALEETQTIVPASLREAQILIELAEVYLSTDRLEQAKQGFERALGFSERLSPEGFEVVASLHGLADIAWREGNFEAAERRFELALEALEEQSLRAGGDYQARARFQERNATLYRDYIRFLVETGRAREAFHVLERSRARAFLSLLAGRRLNLLPDLRPDLAQEYEQAVAAYNRVLGELASLSLGVQETQLEELGRHLAGARAHRDEVRARIWAAAPRLAELEHPEILDLEAAAAVLDPGTLLLAFMVDREESYLFVVGPERGEFAVHRLELGKIALTAGVTRFRRLVGKVGGLDEVELVANKLSQDLLGAAASAISRSKRMLIAPDGPLHSLPFAALADPGRPGSFLIEAAPITVVDSATVYAQLSRRRRTGSVQSLVAFGDPAYPVAGEPATADDIVLRTALGQGLELTPLPATRQEVKAIAALFPGKATIYLGEEATEEKAKSLGNTTSIVHFATHAVVDRRFPLESALVLTIPGGSTEGGENGLLQAWEIFEQVRLEADLVTLSACETARGAELAGEGLVGLTRAFQFAGARSVLASLWEVGDAGTAELMSRFYGYLTGGASTDQALRQAQLDLLAAVETPAGLSRPFFWAAFQLVGDWR